MSGTVNEQLRPIPELFGASEAAEALGIAQQNLRPIPGLPTPIQTLRCGSIWLASDIKDFAEEYRQRRVKTPATT